MFSKLLIQKVNQEISSVFYCDGTFKISLNLQVMIIGTQLRVENLNDEKIFVPFGVLLTSRKTKEVYEKWFGELKQYGLKVTEKKLVYQILS